MKQFLLVALFFTICASMTETKVQRAKNPSANSPRLWSQPFHRPQFFNVRQVLERTSKPYQDKVVGKPVESSNQQEQPLDDRACEFAARTDVQPFFLDCIA
mmetsp:Transcript_22767/g.56247  ORF Transcript_22767/g.56247 Transcript_22767/m.56247 type:complete len:101 (-) Transcript_22767:252-554(-)